ncbi:metal ABC transporter substrate-binding protein [uncultured Enterovirga sp.]|uniref:metal ABC transporter substrate-binding protein n=1 Tax=uncultured Enterovirga sp. TaxID=2026352 RepID=UPI0035C98F01
MASVASLSALPSAWSQASSPKVRVVVTFSILADLVRQVGGDRVDVTSLVGPNADAHEFQPSPNTAKTVADASLVVINGLGLEAWASRLITASGSKAPVITASKDIKPLAGGSGAAGHHHGSDPHAWQNVRNVNVYVTNLRDALTRVDAAGKSIYETNASRYMAELARLDEEVKAAMASIPPQNRKIITSHDAFGYFGKAYGIQFVAPQGVSTETEASARDVALIIRQIKQQKIPAVFIENISDPRLIEQIARETGAKIGGKLYSDALSEVGGPASTYLDMIRNNVAAFQNALRG